MQLLTFLLNGVRFGIPVKDIESIETSMEVVHVPNSLPQIQGILNLHGEIIAVYSLAEQFHYPEQKINNIIVVNINDMKLGLEVANVESIIDIADDQVVPLPAIMSSISNYFDVTSYNKEIIVLIEVAELVPRTEQEAIQEFVIPKQEELV